MGSAGLAPLPVRPHLRPARWAGPGLPAGSFMTARNGRSAGCPGRNRHGPARSLPRSARYGKPVSPAARCQPRGPDREPGPEAGVRSP